MGKQFAEVSSTYGAPMGRRQDGYLEVEVPRSVRLFRVRLDAGGYDDGGAYWGVGQPLWCAIDCDGARQFTRANSRAGAALALNIWPAALIRPIENPARYALAVIEGRAPMPDGHTRRTVLEWGRAI